MAKEVGKVSAELKQVPEEFNKGMEVGTKELAEKKDTAPDTVKAASTDVSGASSPAASSSDSAA